MSTRKALGWAIVALPFVVMTAFMLADIGYLGALLVWGLAAAIFGCIALGVHLADG